MAYASRTEFKTLADITTSGEDDLIDDLLEEAQDILERAYDRRFEASGDTTRYFDPTLDVRGNVLYFDDDCVSVTSITNGDEVVIDSGDYILEPRNVAPKYAVRLKDSASVSWTYETSPENSIVVVGRWAYSLTAPAAVRRATLRLARYLYEQRKNAQDMDRPIIAGNATILPADLPRDIQKIMAFAVRLV